ncbi:CAP domain-containing protein [Salinibacillus aidingensis]|uniref:CAP domain-containing protein n=1 Tax=Salinibacillus aidingensis TaxID=237684 RepID=A0ABN1BEH5_9BACI
MRKMTGILLLAIVLFFIIEQRPEIINKTRDLLFSFKEEISQIDPDIADLQTEKAQPEDSSPKQQFEGELFSLFTANRESIIETLGQPTRKDPTPFGYQWWVYENVAGQYIQVGMKEGKAVTIYATGDSLSIDPISIGDSYDKVQEHFPAQTKVDMELSRGSYQFQLKEEEKRRNPLIKLSDQRFMQLYFDTFTKQLSSVRLLDAETLLHLKPYAVKYRGDLPEINLSDKEWQNIQEGREKQIFALSNEIRKRFSLTTFSWYEPVSEVAFSHSEDMAKKNYFSHYAPDGDGLQERLAERQIKYLSAGENIAAQYPDAAAAVEGWLNSKGHREALLNGDFTHLGTGVYRDYYTQNFLQKIQ